MPACVIAIEFLALAANLTSVLLLTKYGMAMSMCGRFGCARNDAIGNVAVMVAAAAVWLTASRWPDLVVAALMAGLFLWSAWQILRQSLAELRQPVGVATE